jgi:hypothetical protein
MRQGRRWRNPTARLWLAAAAAMLATGTVGLSAASALDGSVPNDRVVVEQLADHFRIEYGDGRPIDAIDPARVAALLADHLRIEYGDGRGADPVEPAVVAAMLADHFRMEYPEPAAGWGPTVIADHFWIEYGDISSST